MKTVFFILLFIASSATVALFVLFFSELENHAGFAKLAGSVFFIILSVLFLLYSLSGYFRIPSKRHEK